MSYKTIDVNLSFDEFVAISDALEEKLDDLCAMKKDPDFPEDSSELLDITIENVRSAFFKIRSIIKDMDPNFEF